FQRLRADPHPDSACDMGSLLINVGWAALLVREAGESAGDPTPDLEEALKTFRESSCARADQLFNAYLNLALAHQQAGRWRAAGQLLDQAEHLAVHATLDQLLWWRDLQARQAEAAGDAASALHLYIDLERFADSRRSLAGRSQALLGSARVLRGLGRRKE